MHYLSLLQDRALEKMHEKEVQLEAICKKNMELEQQIAQLVVESSAWQQHSRYHDNMISNLNYNLQKIHAVSRDSKEGCGDSEVDDTASCCHVLPTDQHLQHYGENGEKKEPMLCRFCSIRQACMLLLPCKHLCLCKECESKIAFCPLCRSIKSSGMEVFL
ncbi:hypothetical protein SAY87_021569 [Trapa incisa]|uniref:RING-type domain-containing protein n=1 Tax=Trapa incisa TaxID=236973 RepID=A0AAN7JS81_9MYRT|nr:hypothetical protein SAY87_021569 [Trapa incisa]